MAMADAFFRKQIISIRKGRLTTLHAAAFAGFQFSIGSQDSVNSSNCFGPVAVLQATLLSRTRSTFFFAAFPGIAARRTDPDHISWAPVAAQPMPSISSVRCQDGSKAELCADFKLAAARGAGDLAKARTAECHACHRAVAGAEEELRRIGGAKCLQTQLEIETLRESD
jgi:hypothetical protein